MLTEDAAAEIQLIRAATERQLAAWDLFVAGTPDSDVTQLSAWARVRRSAGFAPVYLMASREGELVGGAQILVRRVVRMASVAYVPFGPVLRPDSRDRESVRTALCAGLEQFARSSVGLVFVQPPSGADDVSAELMRRGFRRSDARVAPQASIRLDLSLDEEELRGRMNKRLRGWTNRWARRGVTVRLGSREDVPLLADLLGRTAEHQQFEPLSPAYVQLLYDELAAGGNVVLFVGEVDGRAVGVDLLTCCGGVLRDRLVGFDRSSAASKLSVPGAIKWEAIRWAKANAFRFLDFGSLELDTATALLANQRLDPSTASGGDWFKLSFGGDPYVNPPAVETASSRLVLAAYDGIRRSQRGRRVLDRAKRRLRSSD